MSYFNIMDNAMIMYKNKIKKYNTKINYLKKGGAILFSRSDNYNYISNYPDKKYNCKRTEIFKNCLHLYNIFHSGINIYVINNGCLYNLHQTDNNEFYIMDENFLLSKITNNNINTNINLNLDKFNKEYFDSNIIICDIKIPYLYLLLNNQDIFNIYLAYTEKNKNTKNNIFRTLNIGTNYHRFVTMSIS
jgi:hypothetical protein